MIVRLFVQTDRFKKLLHNPVRPYIMMSEVFKERFILPTHQTDDEYTTQDLKERRTQT